MFPGTGRPRSVRDAARCSSEWAMGDGRSCRQVFYIPCLSDLSLASSGVTPVGRQRFDSRPHEGDACLAVVLGKSHLYDDHDIPSSCRSLGSSELVTTMKAHVNKLHSRDLCPPVPRFLHSLSHHPPFSHHHVLDLHKCIEAFPFSGLGSVFPSLGEIVSVTGDVTNDGSTLKTADVGFSVLPALRLLSQKLLILFSWTTTSLRSLRLPCGVGWSMTPAIRSHLMRSCISYYQSYNALHCFPVT